MSSEMQISPVVPLFQEESLFMYEGVMKRDPKAKPVYLLLSGKEGEKVKNDALASNTAVQQRKLFFFIITFFKSNYKSRLYFFVL